MKWRLVSELFREKNISPRKGKFYGVIVRPTLLHGAECWLVKNVAKLRKLRCMCGDVRGNMVKNEVIQDKVRVTPMADKMRETRVRWFEHVRRSYMDAPISVSSRHNKSQER